MYSHDMRRIRCTIKMKKTKRHADELSWPAHVHNFENTIKVSNGTIKVSNGELCKSVTGMMHATVRLWSVRDICQI